MIDTTLSDEQQMIVDTARRLVREMIIEPRVDMKYDQSCEYPHDIFKLLWENGLVHTEIPEVYGGPGLGCTEDILVQQEINYGCNGIGTCVGSCQLGTMPVLIAAEKGGDREKAIAKKYLSQVMEEPVYTAYACSEPDAGSDVAAMSTKFVKKGDKYILNGQKRWITNGDVAKWHTVLAREEGSKGHKGIACFVVDADAPGVSWEALVHKLGHRASHTCDVLFEDAEVPAENLLAGPGDGVKLAMMTFDRSRPWIAAAAAGLIRRARDESTRYALDRKTFGVPILNHQMVAEMVADMEIAYQATHLLTLHAASSIDRGDLRGTHSACAKAYGADAAMQACTDAVQVFGGYGYTNEFVVEKLMRDAKLLQIYEGTSQIQRLVISKDLARHLGG